MSTSCCRKLEPIARAFRSNHLKKHFVSEKYEIKVFLISIWIFQSFYYKVKLNKKQTMVSARMLHFVLKIGDRGANINFFRNILGMKVSSFFN